MIYDKHDMRYKYMTDSKFKNLVDLFESYLHHADFTPSEIREASMLASINYEMSTPRRPFFPSIRIERELDRFHSIMDEEIKKERE